ncbi:hypothetical protein [Emticicia sp. TH156]|uniref:hypothetical protein n=1 Tax=Emticicia sp. TH156 TaxID=2067454 RepID=UPI000C76B1E8|nr:hypothetical protein [Emticicia sp. TH156]PLK43282.1 hypothetical protein C0V77_15290 [Emticicia sp. TH156]
MEHKESLPQKSGITVNYHCELMQNYVPESIIDFGKGLRCVKADEDEAFLFFIDKRGQLQVLVHSDTAGSGWRMHTVSDAGYEVTAFGVFENQLKGQFRIAYARRNGGISELLVSENIRTETINNDLWEPVYNWQQKIIERKERIIDHITMDEQGLLFSANYTSTDANFYYFKYANQPVAYSLPENATLVKQITLGRLGNSYGVFILYFVQQNRTLLFRALEADKYGTAAQYRFDTGAEIESFDLLPDDNGNSVLYTSGKGIFRFQNPYSGKEEIVSSAHELKFQKIDVSRFKKDVAIWVIGKKSNKSGLYYINNRTYDTASANSIVGNAWTRPLQMQGDIEEFESVKGRNLINQLYLLGQSKDKKEDGLLHFWQDKVSTQWHEQFLHIDNLNFSREIESYTIELGFKAEKMQHLFDRKVAISSDENIVVYINNRRYFLIDETPVTLDLAQNQMVNIIYPVKSLQAGKIILSGDFLDDTIEIEPSSGIMTKIKTQLSTTDALQKARTQSGKQLITGVSEKELASMAKAIAQMGDANEQIASGAAVAFSTQAVSNTRGSSGNWFSNAIGDLYHAVERGFETVTRFVVEAAGKIYKVIIEIAGQVFDFLVDTAKKVVAFVEKVFNSVKSFFKDLFEYLAFLFNWSDIIDTKNALKGYTLNLFTGFEEGIGAFEKVVVSFIENIQKDIQFDLGIESIDDPRKKDSDSATDSRTNWVGSKKSYLEQGKSESIQSMPGQIKDAFLSAFDEILPTLLKYKDLLVNSLSGVADKFYAFFMGELPILDLLKYIALSLANIGLELAKDLVKLLFKTLKATVMAVRATLSTALNIPFFSALYQTIAGAELSILDLICLLIAIPTTEAYKIGVGEAPFKKLNSSEFIESGKTALKFDFSI